MLVCIVLGGYCELRQTFLCFTIMEPPAEMPTLAPKTHVRGPGHIPVLHLASRLHVSCENQQNTDAPPEQSLVV